MLIYSGADLNPIRYTDSDFMSDKDSRKSTSGSVFTLGGGAVVWRSVKQSSIADSTMEAEYITACDSLVLWSLPQLHFCHSKVLWVYPYLEQLPDL